MDQSTHGHCQEVGSQVAVLEFPATDEFQIVSTDLPNKAFPVGVEKRDRCPDMQILTGLVLVVDNQPLERREFLLSPRKLMLHSPLQVAQDGDVHGQKSFLPMGTILGMRAEARTPEPENLMNVVSAQTLLTLSSSPWTCGREPSDFALKPSPSATTSKHAMENPPRNLVLGRSNLRNASPSRAVFRA